VVDPHEIDSLVEQGWMLLDVRTREEHAAGAITGSVNVPIDSLRITSTRSGKGPWSSIARWVNEGTQRQPYCMSSDQGTQSRRRLPDMVSIPPSSDTADGCVANIVRSRQAPTAGFAGQPESRVLLDSPSPRRATQRAGPKSWSWFTAGVAVEAK